MEDWRFERQRRLAVVGDSCEAREKLSVRNDPTVTYRLDSLEATAENDRESSEERGIAKFGRVVRRSRGTLSDCRLISC